MAAEISMGRKLGCEFLGTYLLVFTVGCNVLSANAVWGGVSIGCVLMVAIYAMGGISGANFNPAVSFALAIVKKVNGEKGLSFGEMGMYMAVQLLGGALGSLSYATLFWDSFELGPAAGFGWVNAGLAEFLYTFMLVFVVLNVAVATNNTPNDFYGLAIGFVVIAGAYGAGSVSGGCFNPAVAFGIDTAAGYKSVGWFLLYTLFELLGAFVAALLFFVVRPEEKHKEASADKMSESMISEFIGTFILVLTVGLNVLGRSPAAAFSIAASLMCMIYALGNVSGANFNPAVTLAILIGSPKDMNPKKAGIYMVCQVAGGICAGFTYSFLCQDSFSLRPRNGNSHVQAAIAEIAFTFVLCFIVLCVAVNEKNNNPTMFGLAIGSCVTVGGFAIGGISGGSLNPAVSWGIVTSHFFAKDGFLNGLLYTLFEFVGAALAAGVYKATHGAIQDEKKVDV